MARMILPLMRADGRAFRRSIAREDAVGKRIDRPKRRVGCAYRARQIR